MSTRRAVLKRMGVGALVTTGLAIAGSAPAQAAAAGDEILLDSYSGTDDQKLTAALAAAKASAPRRPIRLAARNHTLNCGSGASSWLVGTATTYDVMVAGICFKSSNGVSQFYHHPYSAGTSYATRLDTLTFLGFRHVLGTPDDPFSATLNTWAGDWTLVGVQDTQFSLRGSDNWLVPSSMNYGWAGANGGRYLMRFSNVSKTSVKNLYLTARGGSRAILVEGPAAQQGGLDFSDCVIEGQNANDPAMGALIVVKGGGVSFTNTRLNFGMARPGDFTDQQDTALVMVQGGVCLLTNTWVNRATAATEAVAVVSVSGGEAHISTLMGMGGNWSRKPRVVRTGGILVADTTVAA